MADFPFFQICVCCILSHDRWLEYSFHFDNSTDYLKAWSCKISTYKKKKRKKENPLSYRKNSPLTLVSSRPKFVPAIMISFIFFFFCLDPITTTPFGIENESDGSKLLRQSTGLLHWRTPAAGWSDFSSYSRWGGVGWGGGRGDACNKRAALQVSWHHIITSARPDLVSTTSTR